MKKALALLLALVMALSLAACGGSGGTTTPPADKGSETTGGDTGSETPATNEVVELDFWHSWSGGNGELIDTMVQAFNDSHPNIHVTATYQGDYWESASKARSAVATGEAPDILMMGSDHVSLFMKEGGVIADLVPFMDKNGYDKSDLVPGFTDTYWGDNGELYALSFGRSCPLLYVNDEMFAKAGVEVPTKWDEMDEVCQKLIASGQCEYGFSMPYDSWYFVMIVPQMGGRIFDDAGTKLTCIDDGSLAKGLQLYQDLVNDKSMYFGPTSDSSSTCRSLFLDGKCAMYMHSVSNLANINKNATFDYSVHYVPAGDEQVVNTGGGLITMMESSEHQDEVWEFMQWYIESEEGGAFISVNTGYVPFTYSMTESEMIQNLWKEIPGAKVAFDQISEYGHDYRTPSTGDCLDAFQACLEAVLYDNGDVDQAIADLNDEVMNIIG